MCQAELRTLAAKATQEGWAEPVHEEIQPWCLVSAGF